MAKIIQIMPAPENLYVVYEDDDGEFDSKIFCFGLTDEGEVVMMDMDGNGWLDVAEGYTGVKWR